MGKGTHQTSLTCGGGFSRGVWEVCGGRLPPVREEEALSPAWGWLTDPMEHNSHVTGWRHVDRGQLHPAVPGRRLVAQTLVSQLKPHKM